MASPFIELEVGERVVKVTNPDKVSFRSARKTKLDLAEYYLAVGDGIVRALYERPTQLKRHPGRRRGRDDLPEARAREAARLGRVRDASRFPRAARRRALRHRARAGRLGGEPGRRSTSTPGRRGAATPSIPTSCASTSTRSPARRSRDAKQVAARRPRGARRARLRRLAEDVGQPRHPRLLPDRAELGFPECAPRGARVRARGRAARARSS